MKAFTQVLPRLLEKLEVIRQVLEAHGVQDANAEMGSDFDGDLRLSWTWKRGNVALEVSVFAGVDSSDGEAWGYSCLCIGAHGNDPLNIFCSPNGLWSVDDSGIRHESPDDLAIQHLSLMLPDDDLEQGLSEPVALEAMGMIVDFFAKQPVDAPAEVAATTTP